MTGRAAMVELPQQLRCCMYVLTIFYRLGSQVRLTNENADVLIESGEQSQRQGLIYAWRVVNQGSGKCVNYWKEGEREHERAYQL